MSQTVVLEPVVTNEDILRAACQSMGLDPPKEGSQYVSEKAREIRGMEVRFHNSGKLCLFDLGGGDADEAAAYFKDLGGRFSDSPDLDQVKAQYGVEAIKQEAKARGFPFVEDTCDGATVLNIEVAP